MILRLIALMLALVASPVLAADITATAADASAKFAAAQSGDTLHLTGAFTDVLVLQDKAFAPPVAVDASQATLAAVIVQRVSGVTWKGGTFRPTAAVGRPAMQLYSVKSSTFDSLRYFGDGTLNGVQARDSSDIALVNSVFERPRVAISLLNVQRAKLIGNQIWGWSADGIGLQSVSDSLIEKNSCLGPMRLDLTHIDCVQGYFSNPANMRITIRYNTCEGRETQCVFFNTNAGYANPQGIVIDSNTGATAEAPNGILLQGDPAGVVRNNHFYTLPGSTWQTNVWTLDGTPPGCGNTSEAYLSWPARVSPPC